MEFDYDSTLYISDFLDTKDLWSLSCVCSSIRETITDYIKRNRILDCKNDETKALEFAKQNYRVKLNLSRWICIVDVSHLSRIHTLDLSHCSNITDVSALGGVHTLNLSCCSNVTDVSALGGVWMFRIYLEFIL